MSDLPPYLTHNRNRREAWKGHAVFPRNVVRLHNGEALSTYGYLRAQDLQVFRISPSGQGYDLLRDYEIQQYMEDPTRV